MSTRKMLCIRHGQSTFNAAWAASPADPLLWDARLSDLGRAQVKKARDAVRHHPVDVVLVSPLTRALETAIGVFDGHPGAPPMHIVPLLRERVENSCDVGRAPSALAAEFPSLDFAHLPSVWWHCEGEPDHRGIHLEPEDVVRARVEQFRASLRSRDERLIGVVGHGTFLYHLTGRLLANCEVVERPVG